MNYEGWGMTPAQDFMYPIEYHDRYGYMYPSMNPCIDHGMVYPIMYPDIYYRIYPYVHRTCDRMDNPYMRYPSESQVESMVDDCYDACIKGMPDLIQYADIKTKEKEEIDTKQFRRRPLLRDLIAIILISELFRRRRRRPYYDPYGAGQGMEAGYQPGAGYGLGAGYYPGYGAGYYSNIGTGIGSNYGAGYAHGYDPGYGPEFGAGY
jgi:hypothetical protein